MLKIMSLFRWPEGEPLIHKKLSKFVEKTQKKVEERNFESRKSLLEYDEVMDYQRQVFYTRRQSILEGRGLENIIWDMVEDVVAENCAKMLGSDYPYECITEWARTEIGVDLEVGRIRGNELEELENIIRDRAKNNADQEIAVTLGEYMPEDAEPEEWDLKGLSRWAMSKFSVNVSQNQLRKMNFEDVQQQLLESASERYDKMDLSRITVYLEPEYAHRSLCDWINQKFNLKIKPDELAGKEIRQIEEYLLNQAQQSYRRREIEYPVDFILNVALRREQSGSSFAAKEISDWVRRKFAAELSIEEIQNSSFDKIKKKLLDLNESYHNGQLLQEIDTALQNFSGPEPDPKMLADWAKERFHITVDPDDWQEQDPRELIQRGARQFLRTELTELEKYVLLQIYDSTWKDHLYAMDHLKSGIGLRGYAEKDPKMEYKREGYRMFQEMLSNIRDKVTDIIFKARLDSGESMRSVWNISNAMHAEYDRFQAQQQAAQAPQGEHVVKTIKLEKPKVGRNDPCPCGSGKKYKKCCGQNAG